MTSIIVDDADAMNTAQPLQLDNCNRGIAIETLGCKALRYLPQMSSMAKTIGGWWQI